MIRELQNITPTVLVGTWDVIGKKNDLLNFLFLDLHTTALFSDPEFY